MAPELTALGGDALTVLAAYRSILANPAFVHNVDLAILTKIATDDRLSPRERRRAAEALSALRMRSLERFSDLTCAREQAMRGLGLGGERAMPATSIQIHIG